MKKVLTFAGLAEAATGLALLVVPSLVGQLLLGEALTGVAIPVARVTGIALIGLAVACWPGPALVGMLTYSAAVALYLAYLGFAGGVTGAFLWPAVALHAILTGLLTWAFVKDTDTNTSCVGIGRAFAPTGVGSRAHREGGRRSRRTSAC